MLGTSMRGGQYSLYSCLGLLKIKSTNFDYTLHMSRKIFVNVVK